MRWGVPEQAADNHSTTELCLQEIMKCQEVSVGPSFVVFISLTDLFTMNSACLLIL